MANEGDAERLVVLLEARIRDFEKNMKKAEGTADGSYRRMRQGSRSATRQMEQDMVRSTSRINQALATTSARIGVFGKSFAAGLVGPVAGLLSVTAAINGTRAALEKFDGIAKMAKASGLDGEFFQGLAYHAKLGGVEVNELSASLNAFAKNAGMAAIGKGELVEKLKLLNPELLENIKLATSQEERIKLVADALAKETDASKRAALAAAAFGDAGVRMVEVFKDGASAIDTTVQKARALGIVVDREILASAEKLNDEFSTVVEIVDIKLKTALVNLGPVLVYLAGLVADIAADLQRLMNPDEWIPMLAGTTAAESRMRKLLDELRTEQNASNMNDALGISYGTGGIHEAMMGEGSMSSNGIGAGAIGRDLEQIFGVKLGGNLKAPTTPIIDTGEIDKVGTSIEDMSKRSIGAIDQLRNSTELGQLAFMGLGKSAQAAADMSAESILGSVGQITGILAGAFEDNKALQAANVVVDTAAGIMKAYSQGGMFAAPMAVAIGAAGAAQLGAIMSAQPGSASIASPEASAPAAAPQQQARSIMINLQGDTFSGSGAKSLLERLNDELRVDGLQLVITHRQA
jgi:hypothetical protein